MGASVLAVGGSAGGVEALQALVARLPAELEACVVVTVHVAATAHSTLPGILSRAAPLPAVHAEDGAVLRPGAILVAPPDRHLIVEHDRVRLSRGPRVNRHRPAVDVMLMSAARWAGPGLVAVLLSGALDDGAVGAAVVDLAGGRVLAQDPAEARFPGMPRAALAAVPEAVAAPVAGLAPLIIAALADRRPPGAELGGEVMPSMAVSGDPRYLAPDESHLTRLVCPDCRGSLAQVDLPTIEYYRCHVGHQWSPQSLAAAQSEATETTLWAAIAALEEQAALARHLAHSGPAEVGAEHRQAADRASRVIELLRGQLEAPDAGYP